jgi:spoIIIJ-associated protein
MSDRPEAETERETLSEVDTAALDPAQQEAVTLLQEVCAASGLDCRPVVRGMQASYLHLELVGEDVRATWGRSGAGLDALQYLCNLILSHRVGSEVRVVLDADNYRERRAVLLRQRARDLAEEVKARNEEAELEPLPAHERRIIHKVLSEDPDIYTYSEGDEPDRRIIIAPRR